MKEYDFTLKYRLPSTVTDTESLIEDLGEAGCTDALIGVGVNGSIIFNFIREASSALEAITSAMGNIKKAIPTAILVEASPDIVGLTDIGKILSTSRQYVRVLWEKNMDSFPHPIHEGSTILWHLSSILSWSLEQGNASAIDESLIEIARANMQLNLLKEQKAVDPNLQSQFLQLLNNEPIELLRVEP